ncbi:YiiX family permuted papain-like enzyme [Flavobacterium cerinum]|uniref:YiiX family permuted papain-like enzyme n=1 Tax=Flavobacterium cerinum TaxID=2502784 RepID=A0A3S3SDL4_9FLAO|nr:YiiX family permuted papain-like enzyme [Flavobacterium cerinum]RWW98798.1 YiiX family permuted papain-like enzyme [Flavobacterium cerinum]
MKNLLLLLSMLLLFGCKKTENHAVYNNKLKDGDLIFQTSRSAQSQAIQLATKSKYSHCGIIYKEGDEYFVFEAIQPVQTTPLDQWITRGKDSHYVVKRLKNADKVLTSGNLKKMKSAGKKMLGKNYDLYFEWSNDRIYCSELIWKIYKEGTGIEIGNLEQLKDFDLSNPAVKTKLKERYGANIPKNEKVISPSIMFNSKLLYTVETN